MKNSKVRLSIAIAFALSLQSYAVANTSANQSTNQDANPSIDSTKNQIGGKTSILKMQIWIQPI